MEQLDGDLNFGEINFGGMFQEAAVETAVATEQAAESVDIGSGTANFVVGASVNGSFSGDVDSRVCVLTGRGSGPVGGNAHGNSDGGGRHRAACASATSANHSPRSRGSAGSGTPGSAGRMFSFDDFDHLDLREFGLDGVHGGVRIG